MPSNDTSVLKKKVRRQASFFFPEEAANDLVIFACDIQNAFLTAPCRKRLHTVAGPEFGSDEGKTMSGLYMG
jgi:hypothetical protein